MNQTRMPIGRRQFLEKSLVAGAGLSLGVPLMAKQDKSTRAPKKKRGLKLGFDNFSIRAFGWKAPRLIEYAAELELDTLLLSDLHVFEDQSDAYLGELRARARDLGIEVQVGTGGICPTSVRYDKNLGKAEDHLALTLGIAKALGSNVARCYLGSMDDRRAQGGIEPLVRDTIRVFKNVRSRALDAGIKIAIENHAGDLQARELAALIEEAGTDYVGSTTDSGNATWTLEDPVRNLEVLAPYTVCSGIRDSAIWEYEDGVMVQWTALGDGMVDLETYFDIFAKRCPDAPVQLETISGFNRSFPHLKREFWDAYPNVLASDFAAFLALAKRGKPRAEFRPPDGESREEAVRRFQKDDLERSVRYCKEVLGLGRR
jgi:sugar phosphate isomerase/epimerase